MSHPTSRSTGSAPARAAVPRILLAEDDDDLRALLATCLEMEGYGVMQARDGAELLEVLCATAPGYFGLVICDQGMPGANGIECMAMTRTRAPFVIVSGHVDDTMRADAARFGAAQVLEKPIDLRDLLRVVGELLAA